jgi:hypothetical protein
MNTLNIKKYGVCELNHKEIKLVKGGWCSLAYDIGSAIRMTGAFFSGPGNITRMVTEAVIYDHHCN